MMNTRRKIACTLIIVGAAPCLSSVYAASVIHWVNASNQNGSTALNNTGTFTTTFRSANDVTVTLLSGTVSGTFNDNFGGPTPGNNPVYLTTFVGSAAMGTGDGVAGHVGYLNMTGAATGSLQFDFAQPLTSADRLLFVDTDSNEQYHVEAYALVSSSYVPVSLVGWTYETFSGQTGVTPDSRWPTWNGSTGFLTATSSALNEELSVLTPDQPVSRLVISKTTGAGASTGFQVIEVGLPGDFNLDGHVDAADYVVWRKGLGTIYTQNDYNVWRANFGQTAATASAAVPEPAPHVILITALLALCATSQRNTQETSSSPP
jgi:hypothetical protein